LRMIRNEDILLDTVLICLDVKNRITNDSHLK
jgi:hypothetical protein